MTIQEKINANLKAAMLQKNEVEKSILRVIIGEFNRVDKIVDDVKATGILKKMLENAKQTPTSTSTLESQIIEAYLPKQLDKDQLMGIISQLIEDMKYTSIKDMGKIMADLKREFAGQYDGKLANELIKIKFTPSGVSLDDKY